MCNAEIRQQLSCSSTDQEELAEKLLAANPNVEDLLAIVRFVASKRSAAWHMLQDSHPEIPELITAIRCLTGQDQLEAWQMLCDADPGNQDIRGMLRVPDLRERVAEKLFRSAPSAEDLREIVYRVPSMREKAAGELLAKHPTEQNLTHLVCCDACADEAWNALQAFDICNEMMRALVVHAESRRDEVGSRLLGHSPKTVDILAVLRWVPSLREQAWSMLMELNPDHESLVFVVRFGGHLKEAAARMLLQAKAHHRHLRVILRCVPTLQSEVAARLSC